MQLHFLAGSALIPSLLVSSSVIGSAVAQPWGPWPWEVEDAAAAKTTSTPSAAAPTTLVTSTASSAPTAAPSSGISGTSGADSDGNNADLVAKLLTAGTAVSRAKLLQPADYVYDFNNPPSNATTSGMGGHTVKADRLTFPALIGNGVSMTVGFIGPCGFNTPHVHPRSAEFNIVVQGALVSEFIGENGETVITHNLTQYQSTVFPQGALHTEFNPTCDPTVFVAGFASEDPGVQQAAQTFFGLSQDVVSAALGSDEMFDGKDIDAFVSSIPPNVAKGVQTCLQACNIKKRDYMPKA